MSRKILITFSEHPAQASLINELCAEWTENDCIYILGKLKKELLKENLPVPLERVAIPAGKNELEIWEIFDILYAIFQEEDEVNIDISSCPRIVEMLISSLLQYAKFLKNIRVKGIYCGISEHSGTHTYINLTAFSDIQDWSVAANDFVNFGNSKKLNKITKAHLAPILKASHGHNEVAERLRELNNHIEILSLNIITNRGRLLMEGHNSHQILEILEHLEQHLIEPLNPILFKIKNAVREIHKGKNDKKNMLSAVQWCIDKMLIQEGFTLLQEGIISHFLEDYNNKVKRDFASAYLNHRFREDFDTKVFSDVDTSITNELQGYFESLPNINKWSHLFAQITTIRNDINHGGMTDSAIQSNRFEIKLKELYDGTKELLDSA